MAFEFWAFAPAPLFQLTICYCSRLKLPSVNTFVYACGINVGGKAGILKGYNHSTFLQIIECGIVWWMGQTKQYQMDRPHAFVDPVHSVFLFIFCFLQWGRVSPPLWPFLILQPRSGTGRAARVFYMMLIDSLGWSLYIPPKTTVLFFHSSH